MTVQVGDVIQWRNSPPETVTVVTKEHVIVENAEGDEYTLRIDAISGFGWAINGVRTHPYIEGYFTVGGYQFIRHAPDIESAWRRVDGDSEPVDVIAITSHGQWYFVDREGNQLEEGLTDQ